MLKRPFSFMFMFPSLIPATFSVATFNFTFGPSPGEPRVESNFSWGLWVSALVGEVLSSLPLLVSTAVLFFLSLFLWFGMAGSRSPTLPSYPVQFPSFPSPGLSPSYPYLRGGVGSHVLFSGACLSSYYTPGWPWGIPGLEWYLKFEYHGLSGT